MHYFESATGLRFLINTDPKTPSLQRDLRKIYSEYYVEFVSKNPMYKLGDTISCAHFIGIVDKFITGHANFKSE
jgi:trafficking protein particle complex subunit 1